ncbi:MAG TPA: MFS transporter [Gammaproteobacteria bacterium]|nr:MFS transporter [Gammaproteobacteria bacterium]
MSNVKPQSFYQRYYPFMIIALSAAFLFYKYVLQVSPGIMSDNLMQAFHINGAQLGNLAAMYFYGYIVVQLFAGPLLDKFGVRKVTPVAILMCALGALFFSYSQFFGSALLSRLLIGMGTSFATISYLKCGADHFKPQQFAFVSGLLGTAIMLGAVFGEAPLVAVLHHIGWRKMLFDVSLAGFFIAIIFFVIARDKPVEKQESTESFSVKNLIAILKSPKNWSLAIYSGCAFSPVAVLGGLWGNPFLCAAYPISLEQASFLLSWIFIGFGVGGPILGFIADKTNAHSFIMKMTALVSSLSLLILIYGHHLSLWMIGFLMFVIGLCSAAILLAFVLAKNLNSVLMVGTVIAMVNTGGDIVGAVTQPLVGKFLDLHWSGILVNGARHYSLSDYHHAFIILPIYLVLAWVSLFFVKD